MPASFCANRTVKEAGLLFIKIYHCQDGISHILCKFAVGKQKKDTHTTMLKKRIIPILLLTVMTAATTMAQKNKAAKKTKTAAKVVIPEKTDEEILYEEMLFSTAKVVIIDSIVTDKNDFINHITLGKESGLLAGYNSFFNKDNKYDTFVYTNEFGNKRYFSEADATGKIKLYTADKLGGKWSEPQLINDFGEEFEDINCPFMMTDGITLYFSAKSKHGLGGYDIYVTRYDTDAAKFYKPENIGLPYNSFANDYFYIIDEFNSLGWLVTDRNQPEGKICIYTFIPSSSRITYDENMDDEKLDGLAKITSIKNTWGNGKERQDAMVRLDFIRKNRYDNNSREQDLMFVINDRLTYHSINDFKSQKGKEMFIKLTAKKSLLNETNESLENMRKQYANADNQTKAKMKKDIINTEKTINRLNNEIKYEEKNIRNIEIQTSDK